MSPKSEQISLRLDPALLKAMRALKAEEGIPVAVQFEKAATEWLAKRGVTMKTKRGTRGKRGRRS